MDVNQKELAQCLGITTRQVRNLRNEGLFQLPENIKKYKLEDCVQEFIEYKVNAETGRRASVSKETIQAQHEEVKKQISLIKLRKLRRELHEAADVEYFLSDMLARFKNRILALPSKLAVAVTGELNVNSAMQIIQKELLSILEELSGYDPDEIDRRDPVSDEGDDEDTDFEDDEGS